MQTKQELRKFAKNVRKTLNTEVISEQILQIFLSSEIYNKAKNIAAYYPYNNELNIIKLFKDNNKSFYLPKMKKNDNMTFHPYKENDTLIKNSFNISEPVTDAVSPDIIDLMILPALMCDKKGFRLGYGKGCYDKFLSQQNFNGIKVVFIPDELLVNSLPTDEYDIPVDFIVTQTKVITIN